MFAHAHRRRPYGPMFGPGFWLRAFARHHGWGPPRGGRGFGWEFGRHHGKPRFGRGDLKYVILDLLQEGGPRHGYDIIRAIEERSHGLYSPSPGSVYPTLQMLEDQGHVTSSELDGKRVYAITDAGKAFLLERAETVEGIRDRVREGWGPMNRPEMRELFEEVRALGQLVFQQGARGGLSDPDRVRRLKDVVVRARKEIETIFDDTVTSL